MRPVEIEDLRPSHPRKLPTTTSRIDSSNPHYVDGSVLMNAATLDTLPPNVVVNYLSDCAQVELDFDSCIVSTFLVDMAFFNESSFGTLCDTPRRSLTVMNHTYTDAVTKCSAGNNNSLPEAGDALGKVITNELCWWNLCGNDEITLSIESSWMKTCADIDLPYPEVTVDDMFNFQHEEQSFEDATVTCMLAYAMSSAPSEFGLLNEESGSIRECYPPGYNTMVDICPSVIAPLALAKCHTVDPLPHNPMSYNYDVSHSLSYNYDPQHYEHGLVYTEKLCSLLTKLSTQEGRHCLVSLCEHDYPLSTVPSTFPSKAPSPLPTSVAPTIGMLTTRPTFLNIQAIVEGIFTATFTLAGNFVVVPLGEDLAKFIVVLESSIASALSTISGTVRARVDGLNGSRIVDRHLYDKKTKESAPLLLDSINPVGRRRIYRNMEETALVLTVECTVLASRECFLDVSACYNDTSQRNDLLQDFQDELEEAVKTGSLTTEVHTEASLQGTTILESATVTSNSYTFLSSRSAVRLPSDENDDFIRPNKVIDNGTNNNNDNDDSIDNNNDIVKVENTSSASAFTFVRIIVLVWSSCHLLNK